MQRILVKEIFIIILIEDILKEGINDGGVIDSIQITSKILLA